MWTNPRIRIAASLRQPSRVLTYVPVPAVGMPSPMGIPRVRAGDLVVCGLEDSFLIVVVCRCHTTTTAVSPQPNPTVTVSFFMFPQGIHSCVSSSGFYPCTYKQSLPIASGEDQTALRAGRETAQVWFCSSITFLCQVRFYEASSIKVLNACNRCYVQGRWTRPVSKSFVEAGRSLYLPLLVSRAVR